MTMPIDAFLQNLAECPLVASVQASPGSPVEHPETLLRLAQASLNQGVRVLRLQGLETIHRIEAATSAPIIGLIKQDYPDSPVYITPTHAEVQALLETRTEIIALDGTPRPRPGATQLADLIARIHAAGRLALADIDSVESARFAIAAGADWVSTTLAGYTGAPSPSGPDLDLVRALVREGMPVLAEGRFSEPWQVRAALATGARGVVVGGTLNDPVKTTRHLLSGIPQTAEPVGAVDIGGTWLRFATFLNGQLGPVEREPLPHDAKARLDWIIEQAHAAGVQRIGIGSGGTIDPATLEVWEAKPIIPGHEGSSFQALVDAGFTVSALNDGLATAWGHGMHPDFAGRRVATLALGTGVGFGLVDRGRIWMGPRGEYARLNDVATPSGATFEQLLGGAALSSNPSAAQMASAQAAAELALEWVHKLYMPDIVVRCGGVGLADWLQLEAVPSPYGANAGLVGAGWLGSVPLTLD